MSKFYYIIYIFAKNKLMYKFLTDGMTDDYILMVLGKQFRQMRINAGFSQEDLSAASGLTRKTISSIENERSSSTGNIVALLRSLKKLDVLSALSTPVPVSPIAAAKRGPTRKGCVQENKQKR